MDKDSQFFFFKICEAARERKKIKKSRCLLL
uniref:Uncharacterized protein n=1 Tax=Rhizophora mucronata TaxID=61149 RepID=A0A2P2NUN4_RHIMU